MKNKKRIEDERQVQEILKIIDEKIVYNRNNKITSSLVFFDRGQAREDLKNALIEYFSEL